MTRVIRKILLIQLRPFGDVLLATSVTDHLKRKYPQAAIHFVTTSPFHTILEDHPYIDRIHLIKAVHGWKRFFRPQAWKMLRDEHFDLVMDFQSGTETRLLTVFSQASLRASWSDRKWSFLLNKGMECPKHIYAAVRNLAMLQPLGIVTSDCHLYVTPSEQGIIRQKQYFRQHELEGKDIIVVAPASKDIRKQWHTQGFIDLLQLLSSRPKTHLILLAGPGEEHVVQEVYEHSRQGPVSVYLPTKDIREVAALLRVTDLLICNELSLNHLSCATGTATLCLFGPTDPLTWSPQGYFPGHEHIRKEGHGEEPDFGYSAEEVYKKALTMLGDLSPE